MSTGTMSGPMTKLTDSPPVRAQDLHPRRTAPLAPVGKLAAALAGARDKCRAAHKNATNAFHKYDYASAEEIMRVAGDALDGSGLSLVPVRAELTTLGTGAAVTHALNREVLLVHASGESLPLEVLGWPVIPDRGRPLDKAFASALTTSLAYVLRDLLQMPRVDPADDMGGREDRPAKAAPADPTPAGATTAAPPPARSPQPAAASGATPTTPAVQGTAAPTGNGAPPKTGAELKAKILAADDALCERKLIASGDLLRHVETWATAQEPVLSVVIEDWTAADVERGYHVARLFIDAKSAKKPRKAPAA